MIAIRSAAQLTIEYLPHYMPFKLKMLLLADLYYSLLLGKSSLATTSLTFDKYSLKFTKF